MSKIVSLEEVRKKKLEKVEAARALKHPESTTRSAVSAQETPFHLEAQKTKFVGMTPKAFFVVVKQDNLPAPFPPDSPPPMAA